MKVFIIHYKKLVDRKKHILKQLQINNITDYEFIEIDRDELYDHDINIFEENFNKSQIAIFLSHLYAYKQISKNYDNALIFEDDVILCENFSEILNKYINQLPEDYDMLFIGDGCNLHIEKHKLTPNNNIYEKCVEYTEWGGGGATRCTDSYIVNKNCALKLCNYINNLQSKIDLPIDWWLNIASGDNKLKIYLTEPTIVTQGSENGYFETSH